MSACEFQYRQTSPSSRENIFLRDQYARCLILHGVNVSGACKLPNGPIPACLDPEDDEFWNIEHTFVDRPFPLKHAKQHFDRLKSFGVTLIRLVLVWEAIEREPGRYDEAYLDYIRAVVQIASKVGLLIILDFHQDCWSRFSGGSGAPLWTFEVAGLVPRHFQTCGAALLQKASLGTHAKAGTLWATNYTKFAVNTMFTLFFGGEVFAPLTLIDGENIGSYLRRHYFGAMTAVLDRLKDISGVIGVDAMNEPHHGFIGLETLHKFNEDVLLHLEYMPTAIQSMRLASGMPQVVHFYTKSWPKPTRQSSTRLLNSAGISAWRNTDADIWRLHGVYNEGACKDDYFAQFPVNHARGGEKVDFTRDFYTPFLQEFVKVVQKASPDLLAIIEPVPNTTSLPHTVLEHTENVCYAPHWYDLQVLFEKRSSTRITMNVQALSRGSRNLIKHTYFGYNQAINNYSKQYAAIFADAPDAVPRLVGETGIPFDMNHHYLDSRRRGQADDYKIQEDMLDIMCTAMERNLLSYTLWNYTPENRAYSGGGDLWNGEDFSIYCESEATRDSSRLGKTIDYTGARALRAWIRPSAVKVAGVPTKSVYDKRRGTYRLSYIPSTSQGQMQRQTEIFIPEYLCSSAELSNSMDGIIVRQLTSTEIHVTWRYDPALQTLYVNHAAPNKSPSTTASDELVELEIVFNNQLGRAQRGLHHHHHHLVYFWLLPVILILVAYTYFRRLSCQDWQPQF